MGLAITLIGIDLTRFVPYYLKMWPWSRHAWEIDGMIRNYYFDKKPLSIFTRGDLIQVSCQKGLCGTFDFFFLFQLLSDVQFLLPIQQVALRLSTNSSVPVYNYYFSYDGPYGLFKEETNIQDVSGVAHSDEMGYLFNPANLYKLYGSRGSQSPEEQTVERLTKLWTDFAKTGTPTPNTNDLIPTLWEPFNSGDYKYYEIGDTLKSGNGLKKDTIQFWIDVTNIVLGD